MKITRPVQCKMRKKLNNINNFRYKKLIKPIQLSKMLKMLNNKLLLEYRRINLGQTTVSQN